MYLLVFTFMDIQITGFWTADHYEDFLIITYNLITIETTKQKLNDIHVVQNSCKE